ncbi:MAG: transporter [Hydrogenophilaceae bacterium]|jgi:acetyl-CoA acetyltransferase|nr:transporter [Hydrogenophilaceae bacterium]
MNLKGATAIAGIGQTPNYKRATSPDSEQKALLRAIVAACEDAGVDPSDVDGFCSYGPDRNDGTTLMHGLGLKELRWSTQGAGGGGGAIPGAVGVAAAAIMTGQAEHVIVYRATVERDYGRFNVTIEQDHRNSHFTSSGVMVAAQIVAFRTQRMIETLGVPRDAMDAISAVDYLHARNNPRAMAFENTVSLEDIQNSRWIVEPYRLFNCSRETDGAAAILVTSAERARDLKREPIYLLGVAQGAAGPGGVCWENYSEEEFPLAGFSSVARRLWDSSGLTHKDVDVAQIYENFSGPAVGALIQHGFCTPETAAAFCTIENLRAPDGKLPINTDGGCLAEGFVHGIGGTVEAVRQLRGESANPVPGAKVCLVTGGPASTLVSSALFGTKAAL